MSRVKKTEARKTLDKNLVRARYFLRIADEHNEGRGSPKSEYKELPRAALVFAIGSLDAYLSEITAHVIMRELTSGTGNITGDARARASLIRIQKDVPTLALELALLEDGQQRTDRAHAAIVSHYHENVSNHGSKAIDSTLNVVDPEQTIKSYWDRVESGDSFQEMKQSLDRRINSDRSSRRDRSADGREFPRRRAPRELLDYWTKRRHDIVHKGTNTSVWNVEAECCCQLIDVLGGHIDALAK